MKVNDLVIKLGGCNLGANLTIKVDKTSSDIKIEVDNKSIFIQKEVKLIIGTKK